MLALQILASASYDDSIKIYEDDPDDEWYCFTTLKGHTSTVWSLAWSPNGQYLASASDDRTIRIWKRISRTDFQTVHTLEGHDRAVYSVSWGVGKGNTENLGWLASTGSDGVVNVWEMTVRFHDAAFVFLHVQIGRRSEFETQSDSQVNLGAQSL